MPLPLIIILWPYGFRSFDWDRFELSELEKHAEIFVCDLVMVFSPHFAKVHHDSLQNEKITSFSSVQDWAVVFKKLCADLNRPVVIMNFLKIDGLKSLCINWIVSRSGRKSVDFYQPGVPSVAHREKFSTKFARKLAVLLERDSWYSKYAIFCAMFFSRLGSMLNLYPTYRFVAGSYYEDSQNKDGLTQKIKIIKGHTWDYSRILRTKCPRITDSKYAVLLDGAGPMFQSDSHLRKQKVYFTKEKWYPSLVSFFDRLEDYFDVKIIIAPHPGTGHLKRPDYFGGREVVPGKTQELVAGAQFVITRQSTAVSYAVEFGKPVIFIYSNELIPDVKSMDNIYGMAKELGTKAINIDAMVSDAELRSLYSIDQHCYENFKRNYLTSRLDGKPNYQILLEEVLYL